jgi:hypothetical protein
MSSEKSRSFLHIQTNFDDHFTIVDIEMETLASTYNATRRQLAVTNTPGVLFGARFSSGKIVCDNTVIGMGEVLSEKGIKCFGRRHSSFEPRQALQAYIAHREMTKDFQSSSAVQRVQRIESLLDFHDLVSMIGSKFMDKTADSYWSFPVMSYMNDEEEDSVDLVSLRRIVRGRSSPSVIKDEGELWEFLRDLEDEPSGTQALSSASNEAPRVQKKRRDPSYRILTKKLATEGPQHVLRMLESSSSSRRELQIFHDALIETTPYTG